MSTKADTPSEAAVQEWCASYLVTKLRIKQDRIGFDADFASFGLDSVESVFMVTAAEDWLGLELGSEAAIEHPSVNAFAAFLMQCLAEKAAGRSGAR